MYYERLIRLSKTYQVNDYAARKKPSCISRSQAKLPLSGELIVGMFNGIEKVHNEVWKAWMTILQRVPNALLWLLDPGELGRFHIQNATQTHGVDPRRILIAPRLPQEAHLARLGLCDLILDPWPYGGHTTTSDALFVGVPVLALRGSNFASRVSGSLLHAAGLEALVAPDIESYISLGVKLLKNPKKIQDLKTFIDQKVPMLDIFNVKSKAQQLEAIYFSLLQQRSTTITINPSWLSSEISCSLSTSLNLPKENSLLAGLSVTSSVVTEIPASSHTTKDSRQIPLVLVCGPWGSGTSAVAGMLANAGLQAPGPYVKVNDPRTPDTYEMKAFQEVLRGLASEQTLQKLTTPTEALQRLQRFRDEVLLPAIKQSPGASPIMLKHSLAAFFLAELTALFKLRIVAVLRPLDAIEATRVRRNWHPNLGLQGAEVIYRALFNHLVNEQTPFHLLRYPELVVEPGLEFGKLIAFSGMKPDDNQTKSALLFLEQPPVSLKSSLEASSPLNLSERDIQFTVLKSTPPPKGNEPTVFGILKDEIYLLPHFLSHYRQLGVKRFLFVDDRSTDGSLEFMLSQPDCGVLKANCIFSQMVSGKTFGTMVKQFVPERFLLNSWVLTADLDEFVVLPPGYSDLGAFCESLDRQKITHARALMLDHFPERLVDLDNTSCSAHPLLLCPYFDAISTVDWPDGRPAPVKISIRDGVRGRMALFLKARGIGEVIWDDGYRPANLNKVPLVKWTEGLQLLSTHRFNFSVSAKNQLVLQHFKFYPGWVKKLESLIASGSHWNNGIEYRFLREAHRHLSHVSLVGETSRRYESATQLEKLGLLFSHK